MGWPEIITLIGRWGPTGVDLAQKLWEKWSSGKPPTAADFDELRALANKTPRSQMEDALVRAGIPLDSPQAVSLLALVP